MQTSECGSEIGQRVLFLSTSLRLRTLSSPSSLPGGIQWRPALDTLRQQFPQTTLWRRQMVLGPGKEFALIVPPGINVAAPAGWSALAIERVRVDVS
jgi:hypothetical protein